MLPCCYLFRCLRCVCLNHKSNGGQLQEQSVQNCNLWSEGGHLCCGCDQSKEGFVFLQARPQTPVPKIVAELSSQPNLKPPIYTYIFSLQPRRIISQSTQSCESAAHQLRRPIKQRFPADSFSRSLLIIFLIFGRHCLRPFEY